MPSSVDHGEEVLYRARAHWLRLAPAAVGTTFAVAALVAALVLWRSAPPWFGLVLAALFIIALGRMGFRVLQWRSSLLLLTTSRLVQRAGTIRRVGRELPLMRVAGVSYAQGLLGRLAGTGTLTVEAVEESAGWTVLDVHHPERLAARLAEAMAREHAPRPVPRPDARAVSGAPVIEDGQLERAFERGAITEEELDALRPRPATG